MKRKDSDCFIIEARPYRETSRLLRVFSREDGVISLVAKGISRGKQSGAGTDPFTFVRMNYALADGKTIGNLYGIETKATYGVLRENLLSYGIVAFWFEILREIGKDHIESDLVFPLTEEFLGAMTTKSGLNGTELAFFFELIKNLGYELNFGVCLVCGKTGEVRAFERNRGGFVCEECKFGTRLPEISTDLLQGVIGGYCTNNSTVAEGFRLINSHLSYRIEKIMKSYQLLSSFLQ